MKALFLIVFSSIAWAQCPLQTILGTQQIRSGPAVFNSNFSCLNTSKPARFSGIGAPGSISGSVLGDVYIDTTGNHSYFCFTAGPCTAVGANNWVLIGGAGGGAIPATTGALRGDGAGNASAVSGTGTNCVRVDGTSVSCPGGSGSVAATPSTLRGDNAGNAIGVVGAAGNCVRVDGSSVACPGGGVALSSQLQDFLATNTSASVQTIGLSCDSSTPCQIRIGQSVFSITASVTGTLSGTSDTGTVFWYLSSSQILTAGHNTAATLTCSVGCTVATGVIAFPQDSTPLWQTTFTSNVWDAVTEAMDKRAFISRNVIAPGSGVSSSSDPTTGIQTLSTDSTIVPRYFTGSGAPASTCATGRDFYVDTATPHLYFCSATNTWTQAF